ncbi:WD40 repeat domain-containing serine/threonine protein kinase [Streptomyces sp. CC228A]|uniref:WD40 repeat domain-containing serine/threonine protein kinase n=1 Tax=Streptomyces sp. CC228A TaxID=2898186 RepID=UPI001F360F97|nr:serine/threonine-protein kinase [Streptomyces sp. CC228A]
MGAGGMGQVWEARDETLQRPVAVKVVSLLAGGGSRGDEARARFLREARITAALQHPYIVTVHDLGEAQAEDGRTPFLVMELLRGEGLEVALRRGPVAQEAAARWGAQVADALAQAHAAGVLHRDVKPANILITAAGTVKVLDFGIARAADSSAGGGRLTRTGFIVGTPQYMALEQARGYPEARSDLYALGCVLFEMLTGRLPFDAPDAMGHLTAHLTQEPPAPGSLAPAVAPAWDELVLTLLSKEPERRFGSATEVAAALRRLERGMAYTPTRVSPPASPASPPRTAVPAPPRPATAATPRPATQSAGPRPRGATLTADRGVTAVAFCCGGDRVAYAMDNGTVVVTDLAGRQRYEITHRAGWRETARLAASPDGTLLATVRRPDKALRLWDAATGAGVLAIEHAEKAHHLVFGQGAARIASAGGDRVQIWDTRTGRLVLSARGRAAGPRDAAFSPDGTRLAVGAPRSVSVLDATDGRPLVDIPLDKAMVAPGAMAFSPDGARLAVPVLLQRPSISQGAAVVDSYTGRRLLTLHLDEALDTRVRVAFSPLGDRIATSGGRRACLWDARSGALLLQVPSPATSVHDAAFSPDGTMLATADADRTVRVRELPPPHPPATPAHDR